VQLRASDAPAYTEPVRMSEANERSAAAMRLDDANGRRLWYLGATPVATLPWLIRLRWATAAIKFTLLAIVWGIPRLDLPLDHLNPCGFIRLWVAQLSYYPVIGGAGSQATARE
jgi:hypothetical protein